MHLAYFFTIASPKLIPASPESPLINWLSISPYLNNKCVSKLKFFIIYYDCIFAPDYIGGHTLQQHCYHLLAIR
jgi:hypothetical protein